MNVDPHILTQAAAEARAARDAGWVEAQYDLDEGKRASRYGYLLHDAPHAPSMAELLAIEDDERAASALAVTPQPSTHICPHCAGSGRVREDTPARSELDDMFTPVEAAAVIAARPTLVPPSGPHHVRVMAQAGPVGTAAFWARCSCGWTHRGSYDTREQAQAVADEHTAGV